jgi:DNA invertase Pin-like site-specific DNA recombinase
MRYVVYLRVSTDQQADTGHGLQVQETACRAWLRAQGHRLVGVHQDTDRSGGDDLTQRPGLAGAVGELVAGRADGMVVYRLDRLARDLVLQEQLLAECHRIGRELHSCSPTEDANLAHTPDDPTRQLVRRILGSIAEYERAVIRLRLTAGRESKRAAGGWIGGRIPFGYAHAGGELVPLESEQKALQAMRRWHRQGWSLRQIGTALEEAGHLPRGSERWHPSTVHKILNREPIRLPTARNGRKNGAELVGAAVKT